MPNAITQWQSFAAEPDVRGRVDVALVRAAELVIRKWVEPALGAPVWPHVGPVVQAAVKEYGIPSTPVNGIEFDTVGLARRIGLLPAAEAPVKSNGRRRRR